MPIPLGPRIVEGLRTPADPSGYPTNWNEISKAFRKKSEYKCAKCNVDCSKSEHHHLIDVHHMNSIKSECDYKNLQCLCKHCHSKQDFHSHYKPKENDFQTLQKLWKDQGIDIDEVWMRGSDKAE